MRKSLAWRFFIVALLVLLMFIPLIFVGQVVNERSKYNRQTRTELGREWGGPQSIQGPYMKIQVYEVIHERKRVTRKDPTTGQELKDADGNTLTEERTITAQNKKTLYAFPKSYDVVANSEVLERRKGIFKVPVYTANVTVDFDFDLEQISDQIKVFSVDPDTLSLALGERVITKRTIAWDQSQLITHIGNISALRGEPRLTAGGTTLRVEPYNNGIGFVANVDPEKAAKMKLVLQLNGSEKLELDPVGDVNIVTMTGDWPHPNFALNFLPDTYDVSESGYEAHWTIPRLARGLTSVAEEYQPRYVLGVRFYQPNDLYQRSYRAARYGVLFIGLSFLTIFLIEGQTRRPTHPVQYILVGLVQSVFFLLLLGISEHFGFGLAYLIASVATVVLITSFGAFALRLGVRTFVLGSLLAALYAVLYLILKSTDYALLAGSILVFVALAGTMFATRNQDWYEGNDQERSGWFGKSKGKEAKDTKIPPVSKTET